MNKHYKALQHLDDILLTNYGEAFRVVFWNIWELKPDKDTIYIDASAEKKQVLYNLAILEEDYVPLDSQEPEWEEIFDLFFQHSFVFPLTTLLFHGNLFYSYPNVLENVASPPTMELN